MGKGGGRAGGKPGHGKKIEDVEEGGVDEGAGRRKSKNGEQEGNKGAEEAE